MSDKIKKFLTTEQADEFMTWLQDEVIRLEKENKAQQATIDKLVEALEGLTGYNTPSAYDNEDDDVGHCPYCNGWNMGHYDSCSIKKAEDLINSVTEGE